ncbi:MAG: outer membrane protein [Burkholderiales bacterium]
MPQISRRPLTRFAGQCAVGVMLAAAAGLAQAQTYFRVDTGYAWGADAKAMDKSFATTPFICADPACTAPYRLDEVGSSWIAGLGVGYRWHDVFRTDVTFGWRGGFKLSDFDGRPFLYNSEISSYTLMLNGYIDVPLGGPSWFKPYVGAGVGASRNEIKEISAYGAAGVTGLPGHSNMDVAWQVSVGAGFQLNKSLILDVGYRYLDAGKFESGSGITTGALVVPYNGATGKLVTNELQVGLRF